jgi:hypothetical protein
MYVNALQCLFCFCSKARRKVAEGGWLRGTSNASIASVQRSHPPAAGCLHVQLTVQRCTACRPYSLSRGHAMHISPWHHQSLMHTKPDVEVFAVIWCVAVPTT